MQSNGFQKRILAPPALPAHENVPPNEVTEKQSEYFFLADSRLQQGMVWHFWNAFQALPFTPWWDTLKQYGVESAQYAGYAIRDFPDGADAQQVYDMAASLFAPNRLVVCLTTPDVAGFLSDGWAAYHSWDGAGNTWAIVPCGDWPGWEKYGGSPFGHPHTELIAGTHEWAEYLTDPTGQGFTERLGDFSTEVGDECNWNAWQLTAGDWQYLVTKVWDHNNQVCRP